MGGAWKRPNRFRFELSTQGVAEVQAFDGARGWSVEPPDEPDAVPMAPFDLALMNDATTSKGASRRQADRWNWR